MVYIGVGAKRVFSSFHFVFYSNYKYSFWNLLAY